MSLDSEQPNSGELLTDRVGRIVGADARLALLTGYERNELMGMELPALVTPPLRDATRALWRQLAEAGAEGMRVQSTFARRDGGILPVELAVAPRNGEPDGSIRALVRDVGERRRRDDTAGGDTLTGLTGRASLEEHARLAIARARRAGSAVALLAIEIDDFALVPESVGIATAERVLQEAAARLRAEVRDSDLLARHGASELHLLLADVERGDGQQAVLAAQRIAEELRRSLARPLEAGGVEFRLGASIGISIWPDDASEPAELLAHAAAALRRGREHGAGATVVFTGSDTGARERVALTSRLRRAVEHHEFAVHYQPVVDLATGRTTGAEALIRWEDPDRGTVEPLAFIPAAETLGLIDEIGWWVLEQALEQAARWRQSGLDLIVGVNLSPRQLRAEGFAGRVIELMSARGVDPVRVVLEITESMVAGGHPAIAALERLGDAGVQIALDDFGTGYSSLSQLRDLPAQIIKIDASFVQGLPDDQRARGLARSIIDIAGHLGMVTVAEGVETAAQRDFLEAAGCGRGQGMFLGPPVPANEIAA